MPIYGGEKYLSKCVDSILDQTLANIEVILVDDGSPDKCPEIIDKYAESDSRVVALHKENGGYGSAVNMGIAHARGEYIGIVEGDDWIEPTMYKKLYTNAVKNDSDVVKCGFYKYNSLAQKAKNINRKWHVSYMNLFDAPSGTFTIADWPKIMMWHASVWAALYKADFVKNIKMPETKSAAYQDFPFTCEVMARAARISVVKEYLVHYRMEQGQGNSAVCRNKRGIMMATQSIAGIDILCKYNVLDLCKEEIYYHAYIASRGFFDRIMWQYKSEFFDELYRLLEPLRKDKKFKWQYFNSADRYFCNHVIMNDLIGAVRVWYPLTIASLRKVLISVRMPQKDYFSGWRIQLLGIQIGSHLDYSVPALIRIKM